MEQTKHGYLEIILGPMFSGKTSKLIEIYKQYRFCDIDVLVVNHKDDDRYSITQMSTHDQQKIDCEQWSSLNEFTTHHLSSFLQEKPLAVLINEGQFFPDLYGYVNLMVNTFRVHVYVCGLDGDFQRQKFGELLDLIPMCDNVTKLKSLCVQCKDGTPALFSHRTTRDGQQKLIGSAEAYEPLCRKCYHDVDADFKSNYDIVD